ncbi:diguanylate cyclase [Corynebacterium phocae]|uniref:Diguanylate cyclase n=1 Tax=Corynebacterium phocae TaxID=161895 RepID=A0A1L7D1L0_9CORY|nr:oligopeptide:H+ symporter [Corynebacterium phocae]APT92019.1 diguanylate cyclase [Corynebacterium phocae]KAA8726395.1 MFS transporter [Corynebacterium phocae]
MTIIEQRSTTRNQNFPAAIPAIAGIEMWERFSFYGMQAILAYYLYDQATGLKMETTQATALVGAYGSMLYLLTFAGGWISDRVLGAEKTLITGASMLIVGHLSMSLVPEFAGLFLGLIPIALGSALLKTAAITILGAAFPPAAGKRDSAFEIFYFGINIGGLCGPLLTGYLSQKYGYHAGFAAAAILMAIGCILYPILRRPMLKQMTPDIRETISTPANPAPPRVVALAVGGGAAVLLLAIVAVATGWLNPDTLALVLLVSTVAVAIILFATLLRSPLVTSIERTRVLTFIPLFLATTCFWVLQFQVYGVLAVYSDQRLNRLVGSFEIPAAWTQSLNPFYTLLLIVPVAAWMATRNMPARPVLMGGGLIVAGSGMLVLLPFTGGSDNSTPFLALALCILLLSLGEIFIGPVGMAASATHAPRAFATRFSALWFLTLAIGSSLAGSVSVFYSPEHEGAYITGIAVIPMLFGAALAAWGLKKGSIIEA